MYKDHNHFAAKYTAAYIDLGCIQLDAFYIKVNVKKRQTLHQH